MIAKNAEDIHHLKEIGLIVANCLKTMMLAAKPGMSTWELDQLAKTYLGDHGAKSAPIFCYNFPGQTCISTENQVAHGIPTKKNIIKEGHLINIDVSAVKNSYFGDTGGSFLLEPKKPELENLLNATKEALEHAIEIASAGVPIKHIGRAIQKVANKHRYSIIENLGSHGIGKSLHEEPKFIAGFEDPKDTRKLKKGMVITIEPFLSTGAKYVDDAGDGWTLITAPHIRSAQFEHTMIITDDKPILTTVPNI